jgi:hypothetical protein
MSGTATAMNNHGDCAFRFFSAGCSVHVLALLGTSNFEL